MASSLLRAQVYLVLIFLTGSQAGDFTPETYPPLNSLTCPGKTTPLYFGLLMSFDDANFDGSGAVAGVKVALDRINRNCSLLPDYSLHYTLADSMCSRSGGLDALFIDTLFQSPTKIAVIGSGCSLATEPTAEVSHYYNISQLSCVSSSPSLTNRPRFRSYFQLLNSENTLAFAHYAVIKEYGWRHVSLLVQNENLFTSMIEVLKELLLNDGITFDERIFSTQGGVAELGEVPFNIERRIHLIASYSTQARQLLCQAYALGVKLPQHVLLTPAWYNAGWWRVNDTQACTVGQREEVLNSSIAFLHFNFLDRNGSLDTQYVTTDGLTQEAYLRAESSFIEVPPLNLTQSPYAEYCYNATWSLLYALEDTIYDIASDSTNQMLAEAYGLGNNERFTLGNFTYDSGELNSIIFKHLGNTSFNGVSGPVAFNSDGVREVTKLIIYQFREDRAGVLDWVEIGLVTEENSTFIFTGENQSMVWPNGVPSDGVPTNATVTVHIAVSVVYYLLATMGIVFAVACISFNCYFREKKLIKLTSPNLNFMIGVGAIVLYFNIYLFTFPTIDQTAVSILCNLTPWFTAIGYSLCYGSIVVKMTRVYYIFNNPSTKKSTVPDWMLFLGVFSLVAVDLIILVLYTAVEGSKVYEDGLNGLQARIIPNNELLSNQGAGGELIMYFVYVCNTTARDIMLGILYGYKALLQVIALVFSFSIRKVKVKGLDDAIFIGVSIYVSSLVLAVIIVCTYTLKEFVNVFPVVFCTGFLIGTTVILGLVFIPLMVGLHKDPDGDTIFDRSYGAATNVLTGNFNTQTVEGLRMRVLELESMAASTGGLMGSTRNLGAPSQPSTLTKQEMTGQSRERTRSIWDEPSDHVTSNNNTTENSE